MGNHKKNLNNNDDSDDDNIEMIMMIIIEHVQNLLVALPSKLIFYCWG